MDLLTSNHKTRMTHSRPGWARSSRQQTVLSAAENLPTPAPTLDVFVCFPSPSLPNPTACIEMLPWALGWGAPTSPVTSAWINHSPFPPAPVSEFVRPCCAHHCRASASKVPVSNRRTTLSTRRSAQGRCCDGLHSVPCAYPDFYCDGEHSLISHCRLFPWSPGGAAMDWLGRFESPAAATCSAAQNLPGNLTHGKWRVFGSEGCRKRRESQIWEWLTEASQGRQRGMTAAGGRGGAPGLRRLLGALPSSPKAARKRWKSTTQVTQTDQTGPFRKPTDPREGSRVGGSRSSHGTKIKEQDKINIGLFGWATWSTSPGAGSALPG